MEEPVLPAQKARHIDENYVFADFYDFLPRNENVFGCLKKFSFARDDYADNAGVSGGNHDVAGLAETFPVVRVDDVFRFKFRKSHIHTLRYALTAELC